MPPAENVVIVQGSEQLLQCPIASEDCANVQWNLVTADGAVYVIGNKLSVYQQYMKNYQINSTAGYCMLRILLASTDGTAGHINCLNLEDGNPVKAFNIYIIGSACNIILLIFKLVVKGCFCLFCNKIWDWKVSLNTISSTPAR